MILYHIASVAKILVGTSMILITYTTLNIYEDPAIAIGMGFVGIFIVIRGISFYIFYGLQKLFRAIPSTERIMKDSYKLSLLFGIYCNINIILLLLGHRNKIWGIILLLGFIVLQILLFQNTTGYERQKEF